MVKHARESLNNSLGDNQFGAQVKHREDSTLFDNRQYKSRGSKGTNVWIALCQTTNVVLVSSSKMISTCSAATLYVFCVWCVDALGVVLSETIKESNGDVFSLLY